MNRFRPAHPNQGQPTVGQTAYDYQETDMSSAIACLVSLFVEAYESMATTYKFMSVGIAIHEM